MNYKNFSSTQVLFSLFLVKFYINHIILSPFVYNLYSKTSIIILCIIYLLQPLELLFINKILNRNLINFKSNNLFISIYCFIFSSLIIYGLVSFLDTYIYSVSNIYYLLAGILIPLIFINKFDNSNIIRLTPIFLIITLSMLGFFFFTTNDISLFAIYPNIKVNNIFLLIIFIINITFPYLLFPYYKDFSNTKFKLSTTILLGLFFSLLNILLTLRQGISLGIFISEKAFPLYEILRFLSITIYSVPLDILFVIFLFFYSFYVLAIINSFTFHNLKINNYYLKTFVTLIPFIITILFILNIKIFELVKYDLLVISSFCLIYIFSTTLISFLRSKKNE